jgi:acetyl-CoA carboxylase carboxyl transferase subunit beta
MASYASLGDVIIAEPKSMIGFAGPRVIKETTHQDLPEGFQTAEFLEKHGLIDMVVPRSRLRSTIGQLLDYLSPTRK